MKIREKIYLDRRGLEEHGPITIVAFGDSVTHGAVGPGEIDYESAYWNRLRKKILDVKSYVPVNVINAGIGGITAAGSIARMDRQVLAHEPDLIIVCFGLNDVNGPLETYLDSLKQIFEKSLASGAEVIFMTPNMLNTSVSEETEQCFYEYAHKTAEMQNGGRFDKYIYSAVDLARELGVTVCDCYSEWKELSKTQDITNLLANKINHPTREMHELFANALFRAVLGDEAAEAAHDSFMYK